MKRIFIFVCWGTLSTLAFRWNCVVKFKPDHCIIQNISTRELANKENYEDPAPKDLDLNGFLGPSLLPTMERTFRGVEHLSITVANISDIFIFPTLKNLTLVNVNVAKLWADNSRDYKLEYFVMNSVVSNSFPQYRQVFKRLKDIAVINMRQPQGTLDLSNFDGLVNLNSIKFSACRLTSVKIGWIDLPSLTKLDLQYNGLTAIPDGINRLGSLEEIILSDNDIVFIEMSAFNGLDQLHKLDLSYNALRVSTLHTVNLPALRELSFKLCNLRTLDVRHWRMPNLKILDVRWGYLEEIEGLKSSFSGNGLTLKAGQNPLSCQWISEQMEFVTFNEESTMHRMSELCPGLQIS